MINVTSFAYMQIKFEVLTIQNTFLSLKSFKDEMKIGPWFDRLVPGPWYESEEDELVGFAFNLISWFTRRHDSDVLNGQW